jgi:hypothetical protein
MSKAICAACSKEWASTSIFHVMLYSTLCLLLALFVHGPGITAQLMGVLRELEIDYFRTTITN